MKKLQTKKSNTGITLITLVITIVVLSILAGVSINTVVGDDGIIKKARAGRSNKTSKCRRRYEQIGIRISISKK